MKTCLYSTTLTWLLVVTCMCSLTASVSINFRNYTASAIAAAAAANGAGGSSSSSPSSSAAAALAERTKLQQQQIQQLQAVAAAAAQQKQQQQQFQAAQQQTVLSNRVQPTSAPQESQPAPAPEQEPVVQTQPPAPPSQSATQESTELQLNSKWCEIHVYKKSRVTWLEAYKTCRAIGNGTELATIKTEEDYKLISSKVKDAGSPASVIYWTSGNDLIDEGEFVWMSDGTSVTKTYWATGQPDNHWESEHCIALKRLPHDNYYRMTDENCLMAGAFVCTQPCVFWV